MFPMDHRPVPVVVEYDCRGQRARKHFADAYQARHFYVAKAKAGKRPQVVAAQQQSPSAG
jgi:hypothetical protein